MLLVARAARVRAPHGTPTTADDATLAILFTSGTSGRAKGACLGWRNFQASAVAAEDRLGPVVRHRWLACMPLFHVGGLSILVRSVLFGGPVRLQPRFDAQAVSDALDGGDIAGVSLVPTMLSRLLAHRGARAAPPGLQVVLLGGAAAAPAAADACIVGRLSGLSDLRAHRGDVAGCDGGTAARGCCERDAHVAGARHRGAHRVRRR